MANIYKDEIQVLLAINGETVVLAHGYAERVEVQQTYADRSYREIKSKLILELNLSRIETMNVDQRGNTVSNPDMIEGEYRRLPKQEPLMIE